MSLARRTSPAGADSVVVATLNVRNTADRWRMRAPLLVAQLVALDPDVIGLQEVRRLPDQARWIARGSARHGWAPAEVRRDYKTGWKRLWEGIATLSRLPADPTGQGSPGRLRLEGGSRVAQRVTVALPGGGLLDVYSTHLADGDEDLRTSQARRLLAWMDERPNRPQVLIGDLNSRPGSGPLRLLTGRLRSAYALVHGSEPTRTVHRGGVLDYILVSDLVVVHGAWVAFDQPSPGDPRLFPSDHVGVAARLSVLPPR